MKAKLRHVAIAVRSLAEAAPAFEQILGEGSAEETIEDQKVRVRFFEAGKSRIELLEATGADSPITKFLEKWGPGLHHVAFSVPNLEKALQDLKQKGYELIDTKPRQGADGGRIAFLHPQSFSGVLIELMEKS